MAIDEIENHIKKSFYSEYNNQENSDILLNYIVDCEEKNDNIKSQMTTLQKSKIENMIKTNNVILNKVLSCTKMSSSEYGENYDTKYDYIDEISCLTTFHFKINRLNINIKNMAHNISSLKLNNDIKEPINTRKEFMYII